MNTPTESVVTDATGPTLAIYRAALAKLDECRAACPGIGGDIDAANLRWLIQNGKANQNAANQAAKTLKSLTAGLATVGRTIDASSEIEALRMLPLIGVAKELHEVAREFRAGCERGEAVGEAFFSRLLDIADSACAAAEGRS